MEINWISCEERLPDCGDFFLVIVKEEDWFNKGEWFYHVDGATSYGSYIDDFWDTCNDWIEGNEVHITHWAEVPRPDIKELGSDEDES